VARVQQEMGLTIALLDLFRQQTIGELTAVLTERASPTEPEIAPITADEMALLWEDE
jgi:hypothetical protein